MDQFVTQEIEQRGKMVCTSLGSLLRPLFHFLCFILLIHRVQSYSDENQEAWLMQEELGS